MTIFKVRGCRGCEGRIHLYLQESIYDEELHEEMCIRGTLVHIQEGSPGRRGPKTHSNVVDGSQFHGSKVQIRIPKIPDVAGILGNTQGKKEKHWNL